jgi:uncharacterized RmlC-like cupin family protein
MSVSETKDRPKDCACLKASEPFIGKQGFSSAPAISAETVGASAIHMQLLTIPPGARAKAHKHEQHETAIHVLSGEVGMWYGERLEKHMVNRKGDFVYGRRPHRSERAGKRRPPAGTRRDPSLRGVSEGGPGLDGTLGAQEDFICRIEHHAPRGNSDQHLYRRHRRNPCKR